MTHSIQVNIRRFALSALFLLSLGNLSAQGQRSVYHGSKHYSIKVKEFKQEGKLPSNVIVMYGDSHSEYGGDWSRHFPGAGKIINRGIIGDDSQGMYNRLDLVLPCHPKKIFFECGANDLSHGWTVERVFQGITRVLATIRERSPKTELYVQSILPLNEEVGTWKYLKGKDDLIIQLNNKLKEYCASHALTYIDLYTPLLGAHPKTMKAEYCRDGLHLTEKGYEVWAKTIRPYIYK
ncbi:MAG: GDSL-type esterase/lipase family protein [Prevotella veroralis]